MLAQNLQVCDLGNSTKWNIPSIHVRANLIQILKIKLIPYIVELLAKYCDHLLKKSSKNPEEAELEDTLNQVVSIKAFMTILLLINYP